MTLTEYVENRILYFFSSRLYTEIFGIASVSSWYGIWTAFDKFAGANLGVTISIVILSYVGLFCTKTVRNITASPFAIITDKKQGYFDVPTLFQRSSHVSIAGIFLKASLSDSRGVSLLEDKWRIHHFVSIVMCFHSYADVTFLKFF